MTWFINLITSAVTTFFIFFMKRFGYNAALFVLQRGVQLVVIAALVSFATWTFAYILQLWGYFTDVINFFSNHPIGSGSAYGISLATIWESFMGFMYACGLSSALVTVGNFYVSVVSLIFIKALYSVYVRVLSTLYRIFFSGIELLSNSVK